MWIFLILIAALVVGLVAKTTPRQDKWIMLWVTLVVVGLVAVKDRLG
jgi:hypothetical protein